MNIGSAIKTLRKERGLGQKELAQKCGLSVNALSQIETNSSFPHKSNLDAIARALEVPLSYLIFFSVTDSDVPEDRKEVFNTLNTALKKILSDSISKES
jgi:transcriptional regulator with XRE-family HTH domain